MNKRNLNIILVLLTIGLLGSIIYFGWLRPEKEVGDKGEILIEGPQGNQGETQTPEGNTEEEKKPSESQESSTEGVFPGDKAYDFTLLDREGNEISLSSLKGKVVFINFWTTWCKFCLVEMPHMQEVYDLYKDKDIAMLAVNVLAAEKPGTDTAYVNEFVDERGFTFPILYDTDGAISVKYRVRAFPTTYIINKEGVISEVVTGAMDKDMMMEKIDNALNQ